MKNTIEKNLLDLMNTPATDIVFLCGAGISMDAPSSLPTVYNFIQNLSFECEMNVEIQKKLLEQFYNKNNYRFEALIDEIRKKFDTDLLVTKLFSSSTYNQLHYFLASMLHVGASVLTTNFDICIENAITMNQIPYDFANRSIYTGEDYSYSTINTSFQLVKIHGSHFFPNDNNSELVITLTSLAKTSKAFSMLPKWKEYLLKLLCGKTVVVMGYSCSDDFDIIPLLKLANPNGIIWLNYNHDSIFPVLENEIKNVKVADLATRLPILFYNGKLIPFLTCWSKNKGFSLHSGLTSEMFSIKQYVQEKYPSEEDKVVLNNELLLSYGLYKDVIKVNENTRAKLQSIIAQFRLGYYKEVIKDCNELQKMCDNDSIIRETLYYLSSALYYEKEYNEAMKIAELCCDLAIKSKDEVFYLHSLINYASILYVYASLQSECEQECLLKKAASIYETVLEKSKGVNIEMEANALWGLGDMERYLGNNENAGIYLHQALFIMENIGNSYAIEQLAVILEDLELIA